MKITLDIPAGIIADLMTTAIESGDPVTTARRGGWCSGVFWRSRDLPLDKLPMDCWYTNPQTFAKAFMIEVVEVDDETTGHETKHKVRPSDVSRGLAIMARKFPHLFGQILDDNVDAPCADIFLQCVVFGEEKYA